MAHATLYIALLAFLPIIYCEYQGVCEQSFCTCVPDKHPSWKIVNCTLQKDQQFDIKEGDLPESTTELIVSGAGLIMFNTNCLSRLRDVRRIYVYGAEIVLIRSNAATNLDVLNLQLDIENCDTLRIEEKSFVNIRGPLSVSINNVESVSTDGQAFSWLLDMIISNVKSLKLGPGSFRLDSTAGNVREHGPGMSIKLQNTTIPDIPAKAFGSSAAEVILDNVKINVIHGGAFSANTYNIVLALNSSIENINEDAFSPRSLINNLNFYGCNIQQIAPRAMQSAVGNLNFSYTVIDNIETGALNMTVATVLFKNTVFNRLMERSIALSSWNKLLLVKNSFNELVGDAIVALDSTPHEPTSHELRFVENEVEIARPDSLRFIGQALTRTGYTVQYEKNYFGQTCFCNISSWLAGVISTTNVDYQSDSYCTVDEFLARCFNEPEQNILFHKFLDGICVKDTLTFKCESYTKKADGSDSEIKNPRFPHKNKHEEGVSDRNKKVIGIVLVTCLGCVLIAMVISLIRWMRRRGHCINVKNVLLSSNGTCASFCDRICSCGVSNSIDNARSISRLSVNEYSERHCLNEPTRVREIVQETSIQNNLVPTDDKTTQTLPEELTKELLETLKERLESPENYVEARETIEHLYVLTKLEENRNANIPKPMIVEENIYDLPFQNTAPRMGRNKTAMVSVGTRAPSLDKLLPLSPYNRTTALAHEYFEPKDFAVHLYAEIAHNEKEKKTLLGNMPDVVAEQGMPRGPYLRAVHDKMSSTSSSPATTSFNSSFGSPATASIKSTTSTKSGKMMNRPLPEKPILDPGEGTSLNRLG